MIPIGHTQRRRNTLTARFKSSVGRAKLPDRAEAERVAALALAFLAEDSARLSAFVAESGISPGELAGRAGSSEVAVAVIDHLMGNESLLLTFAANHRIPPENMALVQALLTRSESET
jgi:hypothetical protein